MFLIDDLLLMPGRGLLALFRELHERAKEEKEGEKLSIRDQLVNLYMQLETGQITSAEFDEAEQRLVAALGQPEAPASPPPSRPRTKKQAAARPSSRRSNP